MRSNPSRDRFAAGAAERAAPRDRSGGSYAFRGGVPGPGRPAVDISRLCRRAAIAQFPGVHRRGDAGPARRSAQGTQHRGACAACATPISIRASIASSV